MSNDPNREKAIKWWNSLPFVERLNITNRHLPGRHCITLTGREIEHLNNIINNPKSKRP
jgi:hypothetical protein